MAEIRCPMCGKPNPDHIEVCQHCQARLKPLVASSPGESDSELPTWLRDMEGEKDEIPSSEQEADALEWLTQLRGEDEGESEPELSEAPDVETSPPFETEGEDWLQRIRPEEKEALEEPKEPEEPEETEGPEEPTSDLPAWLDDFDQGEQEAASEPLADEQDEDLPAWFRAEQESPAEEASATPDSQLPFREGEPEAEAEQEELPDWLKEEITDESIPSQDDSPPSQPESEADFDWSQEPRKPHQAEDQLSDDLPDWLSGEADSDEQIWTEEPDLEMEEGETLPDLEAEEPEWLEAIGTEASSDLIPSEKTESVSPFTEDDLEDDELFDAKELSSIITTEDESEEEVEDLAPTDLPDWLQAMRPVEATESGGPDATERGVTVSSGPLAGLRGVLLAEPEIAKIKKPPTFSAKLEVSKEQQAHIKILEELLATEGKADPIPSTPTVSSQRVLRWVIGLILILVIAFAVISSGQGAASAQADIPMEVQNSYALIDALAPGDPVLISCDYEPGMAGEMEVISSALMDHLMAKEAHLTLVSTSPTGPGLASHLLDRFKQDHSYASGHQYINLGYIPGGASGLLGFAKLPQRITPISYDGLNAWSAPPLAKINTLADFKLVIIISDNPDIARAWIEQVQPRLQGTPFLVVASAQAEPILRPYYGEENAQVQGLVSGIPGAVSYEQKSNKPVWASAYQEALSLGLMTAVGAIALGGLINIMMAISRANSKEQGEGTYG